MEKTTDLITIASREPGFAWAGRLWDTEPVLVRIADKGDDDDGTEFRITPKQHAELERQCQYPLFPLSVGKADKSAKDIADAQSKLGSVRADIDKERKALAKVRAEQKKTDKLLKGARDRLKETERQLAQTKDALAAAEARAHEAESQLNTVQVEKLPDSGRKRD